MHSVNNSRQTELSISLYKAILMSQLVVELYNNGPLNGIFMEVERLDTQCIFPSLCLQTDILLLVILGS